MFGKRSRDVQRLQIYSARGRDDIGDGVDFKPVLALCTRSDSCIRVRNGLALTRPLALREKPLRMRVGRAMTLDVRRMIGNFVRRADARDLEIYNPARSKTRSNLAIGRASAQSVNLRAWSPI